MIEEKHKVAVLARMAFESEVREMISPDVYERLRVEGLIYYPNTQAPTAPAITPTGVAWLRSVLR